MYYIIDSYCINLHEVVSVYNGGFNIEISFKNGSKIVIPFYHMDLEPKEKIRKEEMYKSLCDELLKINNEGSK